MDRTPYVDLITSEYINKPLFYGITDKLLEKVQNANQILDNFWDYFNVNAASGAQLDIAGQYLNFSRNVMHSAGVGKNKLKNISIDVAQNGVKWTKTSDSREVAAGGNNGISENKIVIGTAALQAGSYFLSGCPSGGGADTYLLRALSNGVQIAVDYGEGVEFTLSSNSTVTVEAVFAVDYPQLETGSIVSFESEEVTQLPRVVTVDNPNQQYDSSSWVGVAIPVTIAFSPMISKQATEYEPYFDAGISAVDDETYRMLIKARLLQYHWDGTYEGMYELFQKLFPNESINIDDLGQAAYIAYISRNGLSDLVQDLFLYGYFLPKPMGVNVTYSFSDVKKFAWDSEETEIKAGWDKGHWSR